MQGTFSDQFIQLYSELLMPSGFGADSKTMEHIVN